MMLGHLMEWLYSGLGGIRYGYTNRQSPIVIAPQMVGSVTWAKTSVQTPQGRVACHWTSNADHTQWTIACTVPDGAKAEVHLPDGRIQSVGGGTTIVMSDE